MKAFVLACFLIFAAAHVDAAALQMPYSYLVTGYSCGSPQLAYVANSNADGGYTGKVFEQSRCSAGGRGGSTVYYSGCALVSWDGNGVILSIEVLWQRSGRVPANSADCMSTVI